MPSGDEGKQRCTLDATALPVSGDLLPVGSGIDHVKHYRRLLRRSFAKTGRRALNGESAGDGESNPACMRPIRYYCEGSRDIQYGQNSTRRRAKKVWF